MTYKVYLTDDEVKEYFKDVPKKGFWYELLDFSERDYGSSWGFYGFRDRKHIYNSGGIYSEIRGAGNAARRWKQEKEHEQNTSL